MADYSKLTKRELIMTLYTRDLMLENERKRLEYLPEKYFELKQQLHDLPKKIVEEIGIELYSKAMSITGTGVNCVRLYDIQNILDTILKKFGDKNESNND